MFFFVIYCIITTCLCPFSLWIVLHSTLYLSSCVWGVLPLAYDYIIGWGPFTFNIGYFKGAVSQNLSISKLWETRGAKKIIFTACHSGKLKLAFTSPDVIQLAPKTFWLAELISQFFCYSNSSEKITCPSGKLKAEFNNITPKSTGPGLSDTSFFAPCGHLVACIARDFVGEDECDWADNCLFPIPFAAQLLFLHTCLLWCQNCQLCR